MKEAPLSARITIKQAAAAMNVSERLVYMALELQRTGREDLVQAVKQGRMTVLAALKIAKPEKYCKFAARKPTLKQAWQAANEDERRTFLDWLGENAP
jgi:hypothetical protein